MTTMQNTNRSSVYWIIDATIPFRGVGQGFPAHLAAGPPHINSLPMPYTGCNVCTPDLTCSRHCRCDEARACSKRKRMVVVSSCLQEGLAQREDTLR